MRDPIETQWIDLATGSDQGSGKFQGLLALPPARKGPGIVLFQEIFGVNSHIQGVARQYALDGFVVLAPDLFWRSAHRVELGYEGDDRNRGIEMMKQLQQPELEADIAATCSALRGRAETEGQSIGAVGYCLGGRLAYFAASMNQVDAAVSYYGGGIHDHLARAASITCPMQFHYAENDGGIPLEAVEKVRKTMEGRADVFVYAKAQHGFNCWDRASYDPPSAALAHGRTLQFFAKELFDAH